MKSLLGQTALRLKSLLGQTALRCNRKLWNKVKKARLEVAKRAKSDPRHHWVFDHFSAFRGEVPTNFHVAYIGDRVRDDIVDWEGHRTDVATAPELPPFDYEYFEWIDILEAVHAAGRTFTMLELGAGYGRWTTRAALAAAQHGKSARFGLVEGDPRHVMLIKQCMLDNGVPSESYQIFQGLVAGTRGRCFFHVELPESSKTKNWFGQAIVPQNFCSDLQQDNELYYGYSKVRNQNGAFIEVEQFPLSEILQSFNINNIDIVHMDIQGTEADAIQESLCLLNTKARRLSIGTHGPDIEARIRIILDAAGWACLRDYPCNRTIETIFGQMEFTDGLQTWVNPKLL